MKIKNIPPRVDPNRAIGLLLCSLSFVVCFLAFLVVQPILAQNEVTILGNAKTDNSDGLKIFDVVSEYGTLAFRGKVKRTDIGDSYRYRTQIVVVFLPGETLNGYTMTNRTKVADLTLCRLVATLVPGDNQPVQLLYQEVHPIAIRLTEFGDQAFLPDLEFNLKKSIADRATHVLLGVTDGKLFWPIPTELK
jgi:hypothetical protein